MQKERKQPVHIFCIFQENRKCNVFSVRSLQKQEFIYRKYKEKNNSKKDLEWLFSHASMEYRQVQVELTSEEKAMIIDLREKQIPVKDIYNKILYSDLLPTI